MKVDRGSRSTIENNAPPLPDVLKRFSQIRMQLKGLGLEHAPSTHDEWFRNGTVSVLLRQDKDEAYLYPFDAANPASMPKNMKKAIRWHYQGHEILAVPKGVQALIGGEIWVPLDEEE